MGTLELKLRDRVLKRAMDLVGGLVGCIISVPIIAITAIPLKLESPGPLIFKQKRVGLNLARKQVENHTYIVIFVFDFKACNITDPNLVAGMPGKLCLI